MEKDEMVAREQLRYAKLQFRFSVLSLIISIIALCVVVGIGAYFVPKINSVVEKTEMLVTESEESIDTAMDKLNQIDFETLNNAIVELESVIRPLSEFFQVFR